MLTLVKLDSKYCDYLRKYDSRVPYNYKGKELRPFVGVLFTVNNLKYFAPLSSPKPKHLKLKSKIDFWKIDNGKLGAINFNNMLPVTKNNIVEIDLNERVSTESQKKYLKLLNEQLYWLNRHSNVLYNKSKTLYKKYINNELSNNILLRCCNFPLLEEKCLEYNKRN